MSKTIEQAYEDAGLEQPRLENNRFITYGLQAGGERPEQFVLPDHDTLVALARDPEGQGVLLDILEHFGITHPLEVVQGRALAASVRLQSLTPGSPEWDALSDEILERYTGSELIGAVRQVNQSYSSLVAIDGNAQTEMIWLTEDDERTCDACDARAGMIMTWAEWQAEGPPGAAVCEGGNRCRCDLIVID